MKKLLILTFSLLLTFAAFAQSEKFENADNFVGPIFSWNKKSHNFGRIPQHKPVTAIFRFTNEGDAALVITKANASCGCTGVKYPTEPVFPGQTGVIRATFNAKNLGVFNKKVTITSNAGGDIELKISGEVIK